MSIMIIVLISFLLGLCWANEALKKYFLKNFILNGEKHWRLLQKKMKHQIAYLLTLKQQIYVWRHL